MGGRSTVRRPVDASTVERLLLVATAVAGVGLAACGDDGSVDAELSDLPPVVATGHYIGNESRDFADFCVGVDDSILQGCAGYRVLVPASTTDALIDAGVQIDEGPLGELRSRGRATLLLDDLSFDAGARDVHAGEVEVLDAEAPRPQAVLLGEGDLEPRLASQEPGIEALALLASELGPVGTVYLSPSETARGQRFVVDTMFPLSDEARTLLISTLAGEISVASWASFAG
jgi:hypothetical protein